MRGAIQLFIGDLYNLNRRGGRAPDIGRPGSASTAEQPAAAPSQPGLVQVPADPRRLPGLRTPITTHLPPELAAAVGTCGAARGWRKPTTDGVRKALAVLVGLGSLTLTEQALHALRRRGLPVTRVGEFLAAVGLQAAPGDQTVGADIATWDLPAALRQEVAAWVEVLDGRWGRSQPRSPTTIRHYLTAVRPTLTAWGGQHASLREITTEDVAASLIGLRGSQRTIAAVALRSLFAALKARRLIFADPARHVAPGRFPQRPVLGLDEQTRRSLLADLPRPDHRLVVLLAGVHALRRGQMMALQLTDVDQDTHSILIDGRHRPLGQLVADHLIQWLDVRRQRWPASANPHLLVTYKSAYGLGPVSTAYITHIFDGLPTTAAGLRADRLLAEAQAHHDPLRLARLFSLSSKTAVRYCTEVGPLDGDLPPTGQATGHPPARARPPPPADLRLPDPPDTPPD